MSAKAIELAQQLKQFNGQVIEFVQNCTDENWQRICPWEDWPVGVVARHIAAGHFEVIELVKMMLNGEPLPPLSEKNVIDMGNQHAQEHAACTRDEVLTLLQTNGDKMVTFVSELNDDDLATTGQMPLIEGDFTAAGLLEAVILHSGGHHFANMQKTMAGAD